ncbi:hypothetical protein O181_062913 [Austropuccinia psidii MF-1]|uniref:Uncharacterized protein n=1 Tax=Austropuccinia psidii MF-1 TaxID=1389203 RepID=A0A9Q3EQL8_9BASI|nr:hypothetical protein [Austropuccinia psidii MF-1]
MPQRNYYFDIGYSVNKQISMIKCPTHSPITPSKMSNCAIITLDGESALKHPPLQGHTHMLTNPPPRMHMQTHPHMHTPMKPHCTRSIVQRALPVSSAK